MAKQAKTLIEMAYTFGEAKGDIENEPDPGWPLPRIRRGSIGPRGKRALTLYTWSIDGNEVDNEKTIHEAWRQFLDSRRLRISQRN